MNQTRALYRWRAPAVKILLAAGCLYYVLSRQMINFDNMRRLFTTPSILLVAIGALTAQLFITAQRLRLLLAAQGFPIGYWTMLRLTYLGAFFDAFLVTSVGGDVVKAVYLVRGIPYGRRTEAASTLVMDRLLGLFGLLFLMLVAAIYRLDVMWCTPRIRICFISLVVVCAVLLIGAGMLFSRRVYNWRPMQWALHKLPLGDTLNRAYDSLQRFRDRPGVILKTWLLSLCVHILGVSAGYTLIGGLGFGLPDFWLFFVAWFISSFACSFAAFAAIGVGQLLYDELFFLVAGINYGADLATAVQATYILAKLPGLAAWLMSREYSAPLLQNTEIAIVHHRATEDTEMKLNKKTDWTVAEKRCGMIDAELLKILACPWCVTRPEQEVEAQHVVSLLKGELELQWPTENPAGLKCKQCGRFYKFDADGIPNLLVDEAVLPDRKS
ncbi:MAG: lysylphosphatidylglycerol synthase domain-containing protein [Planctomycetota bacterium]